MAPWLVEIYCVSAVGSYCPDSGMAQPLPCPPGGSSTAGQTSCHSCNDSLCGGTVAPRWSQPAHRSSQTVACRPGTYRDTTREVLACVVCPLGWYSSLHTCLFCSFHPSSISLTHLSVIFFGCLRSLLCRRCGSTLSCWYLWAYRGPAEAKRLHNLPSR